MTILRFFVAAIVVVGIYPSLGFPQNIYQKALDLTVESRCVNDKDYFLRCANMTVSECKSFSLEATNKCWTKATQYPLVGATQEEIDEFSLCFEIELTNYLSERGVDFHAICE